MASQSVAGRHGPVPSPKLRHRSNRIHRRRKLWPLGAASIGAALFLAAGSLIWWAMQARPGSLSHESALARLGHVEPPSYSPGIAENADPDGAVRLAEAMSFYSRGDYTNTILRLQTFDGQTRLDLPAQFFRGVSHLLVGENTQAITALRPVTAARDSAYAGQARFLLAKAYIRLNDIDSARAELRQAVAERGSQWNEASQLLEALDKLPAPSTP